MRNKLTILILIVLGVCMHTPKASAESFDYRMLKSINGIDSRFVTNYSKVFSNSFAYVSCGVPAGLIVYGLIQDDKKALQNGLWMTGALVANGVVTLGLKYSVDRKRPFEAHPNGIILRGKREDSPSFPSGHTSFAFTTATALTLAYPKWYIIAPSYLWAASVGFSRMQLGVHYPSDVLCGALIGAGSAWLGYEVNKWWMKKHEAKKSKASKDILEAYNFSY